MMRINERLLYFRGVTDCWRPKIDWRHRRLWAFFMDYCVEGEVLWPILMW